MRNLKEILKDYIIYKNRNLNYSKEEINQVFNVIWNNPEEKNNWKDMLINDIYETKDIKGQTVSTLKAFKIFCSIIIKENPKNNRTIWNSFLKKQFIMIENHRYTCYMSARAHGKTFFLILYTLFKQFLLPYYEIVYCSNVPAQCARFTSDRQLLINTNELLLEKKDVEGIKAKRIIWNKKNTTYNKGLLETTTVGTSPRGGHYNLAIGDDPLRDDMLYSNESIIAYFQGTLRQVTYANKARYIIVGTPQDYNDLFHTLMNDELDKQGRAIGKLCNGEISASGFYSKLYPAILNNKTKEVLAPDIFTYDELMQEKKTIGEIMFAREMMVTCVSSTNSLIGSFLFNKCCDTTERIIQSGENGKNYMIIVDCATSDAKTADFSAMTVWELDKENNKLILRHLYHVRGKPITDPSGGIDDQTHKLFDLWKNFNNPMIVIESNNSGINLIQSFKNLCARKKIQNINLISHYTHNPSSGERTSKEGKNHDIIRYIEAMKDGKIIFPANYDDIYTINTLKKVKREHLSFGIKLKKGKEVYEALAGHDDIFDTCYIAYKYSNVSGGKSLCFAITMP